MFQPRSDEQDYAWVPQAGHPETNRYGQPIETVPDGHELRGKSLNINGDSGIGDNPNRYKQHGFYFNADNCIACHACESACSEKNGLPAHLAFRAVGYVEGGTYPDFRRMNISMACNHCDEPVCLKGCPTRAYTKFAEYGAVLQDPDICFGCGYCTWVCPYNAPQLDPVKGQVSKCNMCVDRLEVGLKPACVSACLAGALDFGIIETKPENREQLEAHIPGFPTPEITHPNIRFQQAKSLPREMTRTDAMPLKYVKNEDGLYRSELDKRDNAKHWNLAKLRSREDPLVIFTLATQLVVGAFLALFLGSRLGMAELSPAAHPLAHAIFLVTLLGVETFALALSTLHLGKPHRFYRAFNNLKHSPVSREVAGVAVFYNALGGYTLFAALPELFGWLPQGLVHGLGQFFGVAACIAGPAAIWFMHRIYRIPARPFWNHWQVLNSFYGSMLTLGALSVGLVFGMLSDDAAMLRVLAAFAATGLALEGIGLAAHARDLKTGVGEAQAAHHLQTTTHGQAYLARNVLLAAGLLLALAMAAGFSHAALWWMLAALLIPAALIGRALF
ncbi:MAG: DmsC/YnfH family molybdoenzyme membrane anchor subunit, partial [Candidatus Rokuibacteriota bacterium]